MAETSPQPAPDPPDDHEAVCRAMAEPAIYPHPVTGLRRVDTHISTVFLTGKWAYKLKKPLDLGFLDFTTLAKRRLACRREVALNRRFSNGVYDGLLTVTAERDGGFVLDGRGRAVQAAVRMRQLPEAASLRQGLLNGRMREKEIRRIGVFLAHCHAAAARSRAIDRFGGQKTIAFNCRENLVQIAPFAGPVVDPQRLAFIDQASLSFLKNRRAVFRRRRSEGRIRDGHGDLRCEHIYFYRGIQVIDCIEFNQRFRYGDVALDLAFLTMDMTHLGFADFTRCLLEAYALTAEDPGLFAVLDFYAAYRAMVRLKIACLVASQMPGVDKPRSEARLYLDQAYRYALQFSRPVLWVVCGLPASGKSTLARALHQALDWDWIRSDALRDPCRPADGGIPAYGQACYRRQWRDRVYARLLGEVQQRLKAGASVIADATFSRRKWRREAARLAADLAAGLVFIHCRCDEATARQRLARRRDGQDVSDARLSHWPELRDEFEPVTEIRPETLVEVNTGGPVQVALCRALCAAHGRLQEQIRNTY